MRRKIWSGFCSWQLKYNIERWQNIKHTEWKPQRFHVAWHIANALLSVCVCALCIAGWLLFFFLLSALRLWHDCVVNKREYLMFQTIYNHICKIERYALTTNKAIIFLLCRMKNQKKNTQHSYIGLAPSLKRICMRMFSGWQS